MALSAAAQAARNNHYGTLAHFRQVAATKDFKLMAGVYAREHGLKNKRAPLAATSRFARIYGRTYFKKDGTLRTKPHKGYRDLMVRTLNITPDMLDRMENY